MSSAPTFEPLDAPFDQYQRYRITAEVARALSDLAAPSGAPDTSGTLGKPDTPRARDEWHEQAEHDALRAQTASSATDAAAPPRLLDVGGHHTDPWGRPQRPITAFLPDCASITLDVTDNPLPGFVRGRGDALPFTSSSFELVCSVDVLEHVPPDARPLMLRELTRVSSRAIVLAAPFRHRDVDRAEALLSSFVLRTNGYVQGQLKEHREFGWPDLAETVRLFTGEGWHVRLFPYGNLWRWTLMMLDKHAVAALPGGRAVQSLIDRRYNESWFEHDRALPCYRHFLVATRQPDDALLAWSERRYGAVGDPAAVAPTTSAEEADRLFDMLHLHAENQTVQAQSETVRRAAHLAELETRYAEQQRCLEAESREKTRLVELLRDVEQSPAYRVGALLRRLGRGGR